MSNTNDNNFIYNEQEVTAAPAAARAARSKNPIKGIKIQTLNYAMIICAAFMMILLAISIVSLSREYNGLRSDIEEYIQCKEAISQLLLASDDLTGSMRLFVETGDLAYVEEYYNYANVERKKEKALDTLKRFHDHDEVYLHFVDAMTDSANLMTSEYYAIKLAAEAYDCDMSKLPNDIASVDVSDEVEALDAGAKWQQARSVAFGPDYENQKRSIRENTDKCVKAIAELVESKYQISSKNYSDSLRTHMVLIALLFVMNIITFAIILSLIVKPLKVYIKCMREDTMISEEGAYEFKYLANTYNHMYRINSENEEILRHKAEHDPLTGIMNRGAFESLQEHLLGKPNVALLLLDVDYFKTVNDTFGHEVGDAILKKTAHLLEDTFRATDYPARIGGDEFAVIMTDASETIGNTIINKVNLMNDILSNPDDGLPPVSISVGVAFAGVGYSGNLYRDADIALYEVKEHGRKGCRIFKK